MSSLRDYQVEPVDNVIRCLTVQPGQEISSDGLRAQLIAACGTGKTFMSAHAGIRLARRQAVLVLVPTLDLLSQTIDTWRAAGRAGRMYAVCSLSDHAPALGVLCTTSAQRLAFWIHRAGPEEPVTVFGTYSSLPVILDAHLGFPPAIASIRPWALIVVDEAHRTSGSAAKAWTAVHDNTALPALRRLYMTATPRVWNLPEPEGSLEAGLGPSSEASAFQALPRGLAMSMDDEAVFGSVADKSLTLARCQELGILARYQLIALEIADPVLADMLEKDGDAAREARLGTVQVALLKAVRDENLSKVIAFHNRVSEAEVFAATLPGRVHAEDDLREAFPNGVWARHLNGEHTRAHRRRVLSDFDSETPGGRPRPAILGNVKLLGEGIDGRSDAVVFLDPRGSIVDLVQAVGRALRQQPGQDKLASIVVPIVVRRPGTATLEDAAAGAGAGGGLVSDPAFRPLFDILQSLRSHDSDLVEGLVTPQRRSTTEQPTPWIDEDGEAGAAADVAGQDGEQPRIVLRFAGAHHSSAEIAAAVRLRVLSPEAQAWLRGYAAAQRWHALHGSLAVPTAATEPGASDFPLGRWVADQRAAYAAADLLPSRIERLEELGMIWSAHEAAWEAGLTAAKDWAATHGHLAAPAKTVIDGYPVGRWLAEQRSAAGRDATVGGLTDGRRKALEGIDPWWCPAWPLPWQRSYRTALTHVDRGGTLLDLPPGHLIAGEDIGAWARAQQTKWADLGAERREMMGRLGITTPVEPATPVARTKSRADRFATGLQACRLWHARHGTIADVKRSDTIALSDGSSFNLGLWIMNIRQRAAKLSDEQYHALDQLGMRW